jgi:glycosyltransferase involved in cell wall biosynthesis
MGRRVPTRLLSFGKSDFSGDMDGVSLRIIGGDWHRRGREHNPVSRELVGEVLQADVVHCHQRNVQISKLAAAVSRVAGRRIAVTDHGGGAWDWTQRFPTTRLFERHLHVSRFSLKVAGQEQLPGAHVVMVGVDVERFSPAPHVPLNGRVLFVGRLLPHKGVDDLILAMPEGVGLDVVGPAVDERHLADLRDLSRGRDVSFRHDVDDAELITAYRSSLCVVLPSKYDDRYGGHTAVPELLGQTLLEGMACGRPALCTSAGGMPEVVVDGLTGFVVDPGDPSALGARLRQLIGDSSRRERMGAAARQRVIDEFTWDRVVDRCLDAYT